MSQKDVSRFLVVTNAFCVANHGALTSIRPYALPTSEWVQKVFTPHFADYLFYRDLRKWEAGQNDCVKFTLHGISEAYTVYRHDKNRLPETTLAVGMFDYFSGFEFDAGHEIMFFIVDDGFGPELKFYEPQKQDFIILDPFEYLTCYHFRM